MIVKTKFGNASLNAGGYYRITSAKEGNCGKLLHRLIFEDFYNIKLDKEFPNGVVIHHIDKNRTNNEIWNLDLMPLKEHTSMHKSGKKHHQYGKSPSHRTRLKQSKSCSKTGYFRVNKRKDLTCSQGFIWVYHYKDDGGNSKCILRVNLKDLKEAVLQKGLEWKIVDKEKAIKSGAIEC